MKKLLLAFLLCGCSTDITVDNGPEVPSHSRLYDATKGGLQIVEIMYDQAANKTAYGWTDEVIVLETDRSIYDKGLSLYAGDEGQIYPLPDTIEAGRLHVFTSATGLQFENEYELGLRTWIWNNAEPDTAMIFSGDTDTLSVMTYR